MYKLRLKKEDDKDILEMEMEGVIIAKSLVNFPKTKEDILKYVEHNGYNVNKEGSPFIYMPVFGHSFLNVLNKYIKVGVPDMSIPICLDNAMCDYFEKVLQVSLNEVLTDLIFGINDKDKDLEKLRSGEEIEYNAAYYYYEKGYTGNLIKSEFKTIQDIVDAIKSYLR